MDLALDVPQTHNYKDGQTIDIRSVGVGYKCAHFQKDQNCISFMNIFIICAAVILAERVNERVKAANCTFSLTS